MTSCQHHTTSPTCWWVVLHYRRRPPDGKEKPPARFPPTRRDVRRHHRLFIRTGGFPIVPASRHRVKTTHNPDPYPSRRTQDELTHPIPPSRPPELDTMYTIVEYQSARRRWILTRTSMGGVKVVKGTPSSKWCESRGVRRGAQRWPIGSLSTFRDR